MDRKLGEAREEIEERKYGATTRGVEDFVDTWDHDLGYVGDFVGFLVVGRYSNVARLFRYADERAGPWRSGVLYEARGDIKSTMASTCLDRIGFRRYGLD